jgi:hypothetical protein
LWAGTRVGSCPQRADRARVSHPAHDVCGVCARVGCAQALCAPAYLHTHTPPTGRPLGISTPIVAHTLATHAPSTHPTHTTEPAAAAPRLVRRPGAARLAATAACFSQVRCRWCSRPPAGASGTRCVHATAWPPPAGHHASCTRRRLPPVGPHTPPRHATHTPTHNTPLSSPGACRA